MKRILTLSFSALLLAGIITINSCSTEPLIVPYDFGVQTFHLTADPLPQHYQTFTYDVLHTSVTAALTAAGITDVGRVTKAGLKTGFKAQIVATGTNLDQIGNIEVYMKELGTGGTGDQVAYSDVLASGATEVNLLVNGAELKTVVTKDVTFTVKILNKTALTAQDIKLTNGIIEVSVRK